MADRKAIVFRDFGIVGHTIFRCLANCTCSYTASLPAHLFTMWGVPCAEAASVVITQTSLLTPYIHLHQPWRLDTCSPLSRPCVPVVCACSGVCGYPRVQHGGFSAAFMDECMGMLFYALRARRQLPFVGPRLHCAPGGGLQEGGASRDEGEVTDRALH